MWSRTRVVSSTSCTSSEPSCSISTWWYISTCVPTLLTVKLLKVIMPSRGTLHIAASSCKQSHSIFILRLSCRQLDALQHVHGNTEPLSSWGGNPRDWSEISSIASLSLSLSLSHTHTHTPEFEGRKPPGLVRNFFNRHKDYVVAIIELAHVYTVCVCVCVRERERERERDRERERERDREIESARARARAREIHTNTCVYMRVCVCVCMQCIHMCVLICTYLHQQVWQKKRDP
jgi:hypothetical protein